MTTHVVQNKRNTAKGLQALINAKYIVTNTYVDALLEATTSGDPLEEESFSLLEDDFEKNWPDPITYLPAKSKEPNERPAELFTPNPDRSNILEGYSFVFCDQVQFETLLQPITNAGGKPFEYKLKLGETRCDQIVRYVKELAGEKSMGEFEDESEGKGVVVVRFRGGSKDYEDWAINLGDQVAIALGQRLIEQSEFMDAILMNDASMLRKPLQIEDEPGMATTLGFLLALALMRFSSNGLRHQRRCHARPRYTRPCIRNIQVRNLTTYKAREGAYQEPFQGL